MSPLESDVIKGIDLSRTEPWIEKQAFFFASEDV